QIFFVTFMVIVFLFLLNALLAIIVNAMDGVKAEKNSHHEESNIVSDLHGISKYYANHAMASLRQALQAKSEEGVPTLTEKDVRHQLVQWGAAANAESLDVGEEVAIASPRGCHNEPHASLSEFGMSQDVIQVESAVFSSEGMNLAITDLAEKYGFMNTNTSVAHRNDTYDIWKAEKPSDEMSAAMSGLTPAEQSQAAYLVRKIMLELGRDPETVQGIIKEMKMAELQETQLEREKARQSHEAEQSRHARSVECAVDQLSCDVRNVEKLLLAMAAAHSAKQWEPAAQPDTPHAQRRDGSKYVSREGGGPQRESPALSEQRTEPPQNWAQRSRPPSKSSQQREPPPASGQAALGDELPLKEAVLLPEEGFAQMGHMSESRQRQGWGKSPGEREERATRTSTRPRRSSTRTTEQPDENRTLFMAMPSINDMKYFLGYQAPPTSSRLAESRLENGDDALVNGNGRSDNPDSLRDAEVLIAYSGGAHGVNISAYGISAGDESDSGDKEVLSDLRGFSSQVNEVRLVGFQGHVGFPHCADIGALICLFYECLVGYPTVAFISLALSQSTAGSPHGYYLESWSFQEAQRNIAND
ncbi:hypothetical protein CYMTET_20880, partial [Cymbomonas tetramitiformis]